MWSLTCTVFTHSQLFVFFQSIMSIVNCNMTCQVTIQWHTRLLKGLSHNLELFVRAYRIVPNRNSWQYFVAMTSLNPLYISHEMLQCTQESLTMYFQLSYKPCKTHAESPWNVYKMTRFGYREHTTNNLLWILRIWMSFQELFLLNSQPFSKTCFFLCLKKEHWVNSLAVTINSFIFLEWTK